MNPTDKQVDELKASLTMFKAITMFFILVVALGTVFFHLLEKWNWIDSIYFVMTTISTVGYGNLIPSTNVGKIANILLIVIGIGIFGIFVNQFIKYQGLRTIERRAKHQKLNNKK